jgi:hypothetical protein
MLKKRVEEIFGRVIPETILCRWERRKRRLTGKYFGGSIFNIERKFDFRDEREGTSLSPLYQLEKQ